MSKFSKAPGDVLLEIRFHPDMLVAWDPNGGREIERAYLDESNGPDEAFRAAIRTLAAKIADNRDYVEGGAS